MVEAKVTISFLCGDFSLDTPILTTDLLGLVEPPRDSKPMAEVLS